MPRQRQVILKIRDKRFIQCGYNTWVSYEVSHNWSKRTKQTTANKKLLSTTQPSSDLYGKYIQTLLRGMSFGALA